MNPPFLPPTFAPGPPATPAWESGPANFVPYNGKNQTAFISTAQPSPPAELGPGKADPAISQVNTQAPTGNGYGPIGVGTIGVGEVASANPGPPAAQIRFYVGQDGNLYGLDNISGLSFKIAQGAAVQPPVYAPTK